MNEKSGICDICGRGPFSVVARHKRHKHPEWEAPHGSVTSYTQNKCRCHECREAFLVWKQGRTELIAAGDAVCPDCLFRSSPNGVMRHRNRVHGKVHGVVSTYTQGCRCDLCKAAHTKWSRESQQSRNERKRGDKTCPTCGETGFVKLGYHMRSRHGVDTTPAHGTASRYSSRYKCRCEPCTHAASQRRTDARWQARRRSGRPVFTCSDCKMLFGSEDRWLSHETREHGIRHVRPFYCAACGQSFRSSISQRKHEAAQHGVAYWGRYVWRKNRAIRLKFVRPRSQTPEREFCLQRNASNGGHAHIAVCAESASDAVKKLLTRHSAEQIVAALSQAVKQ